MKTIKAIIILTMISIFSTTTYAAEVPRESAPYNAPNEAIVIVESFIGDILTEVQNGLGYADARENPIAYSLMLGSIVRQMVIVTASLLP